MQKKLFGVLVPLLAISTPVYADTESWNFIETRVPLVQKSESLPKMSLKIFSGTFFNKRSDGLGDLLLRVGPVIDINSWLSVSIHGVVMADKSPTGSFIQENRLEIEPDFYTKIYDFGFIDRNRLEYRHRYTGEQILYRNMLKASYAPKGMFLSYFISDEIFLDTIKGYMVQNRALAGVEFNINSNIKLSSGYLFRSRYINTTSSWENDNIVVMTLTSDFTK